MDPPDAALPDSPVPESPDANGWEALVARTAGPQPWRRVFHAANGGLLAFLVGGLGVPPLPTAVALAVLLFLLVAVDTARLRARRLNVLFFLWFRPLASPREAGGPASSTWYVAGAAAVLVLFPLDAALAGILVLAFADPAASFLGRRYGRIPFGTGTVEGSAVFFLVALGSAAVVVSLPAALAAAALATLAESWRGPIDDNLTVPLAGALAVLLVQGTG